MTDHEKKRLGRAVLEMRRRQEMTQEELSDKTGITQPYLSLVENGRRAPGLDLLSRIADAFDVKLFDIFQHANI